MNWRSIICIFLAWFFATQTIHSQVDLAFSTDTSVVELGMPFELQLTLKFDPETSFMSSFPDLELTEGFDLEVLDTTDWDTVSIDPLVVLKRTWNLMAFDTGTLAFQTTPLPYTYNFVLDTATNRDFSIRVNTAPSDQEDLYPIKDLERVQTKSWAWLWIIGIAIFGLSFILLVRYFYLNRKKQISRPVESPPIPTIKPIDKALSALENLKPKTNTEIYQDDSFYVDLSKIIKIYLEERTQNPVTNWTSATTIEHFSKVISVHALDTLRALLNQSDMVKFAKANTEEETRKAAIEISTVWFRTVDPTLWKPSQPPLSEKIRVKDEF